MMRPRLVAAVTVAALGGAAATVYVASRVDPLDIHPPRTVPVVSFGSGGVATVRHPVGHLLAEVDTFSDEIFAFLRFEHLVAHRPEGFGEGFLTIQPGVDPPLYVLWIELPNDLARAAALAAQLKGEGRARSIQLVPAAPAELDRKRSQTRVFQAAYALPARRSLEQLTPAQRLAAAQRYVQYKAAVDGRVRSGAQSGLEAGEALQFGADIVAVADFFELPLDFFLGIGAVENNYLNVRGDLKHAIWKRRLDPGDIVLRRSKGRYLVANFSSGPWQITRETLRHAHRLFRKDDRDYGKLAAHLRPPPNLDVAAIEWPVLTTYAGLLLRDLLDHFGGDVGLAVGAYNGGVARPNAQYSQSVKVAAGHARRVIEQAAALNGRAAEMKFWTKRRAGI